jgi:hypothetical protein
MNKIYQDLFEVIWNQVFTDVSMLSIEDFKKNFIDDILLPERFKCELSGEVVWSSPEYGYKRFISKAEANKRTEKDNFMEVSEKISSLDDVLGMVKDVALFKGERDMNSSSVEESDDIYSSDMVYNSTHIYSSQKVLWCNNVIQSEYVVASKGSKNTSFSIRVIDSGSVSNSFDISFCANASNSYFCHNCFDIRDCMFCFHLTSKRFCIANRQYDEAEYFKIKKKIISDYFEQLKSGKFVSLRSL